MKIAIPTIGGILDETLSSCEVFTIFTVDETNTVTDSKILCTPVGCDCKNNIPLTLQQKGVTAILAFELPPHAEEICLQHGITAHAGFSGEISEIIKEFLKIKE
jgi:predicted Fe-Mo cluster-binding NifX family protein